MFLNVGSYVKDDEGRKYILEDIIGQGGFGYVFKSHRECDGAIFAIKTTLPSFNDTASEESFKNEIQSAIEIKGKNIINYIFAHSGDLYPEYPPYIIMEYAEGGTLRKFINDRKQAGKTFSISELKSIYLQLAEGMKQVNSKLIHRDVKPENILICDNVLKISDFGLSKVTIEKTRTMTFKGSGTPLYMAPEAFDYSKNTIQMDIYSMGIIFYELATFSYPYSPIPTTYEDIKNTHLLSPIDNVTRKNSNLPSTLVSVINRMLAKPVKERFSSWDEIIEFLDKQVTPSTDIDRVVEMAIATQNAKDIARQQLESKIQKEVNEIENFCKLVQSQIENTIISPIRDFINKVNSGYAGTPKMSIENRNKGFSRNKLSYKIRTFSPKTVSIDMEIILKQNHTREVPIKGYWDNRTRQENYIPQYNRKNILAWGSIQNFDGYGFNILLVDSGDIYGDWLIMKNKNNLSVFSGKERKEPFSFSIEELPTEINYVQATHLYRSEFIPYNEVEFIELLNVLISSQN